MSGVIVVFENGNIWFRGLEYKVFENVIYLRLFFGVKSLKNV